MVQGHHEQNFSRSPISREKKMSVVVQTYHPSYGGKYKITGSLSRLAWAKNETLSPE
jgi:hypothetical protein